MILKFSFFFLFIFFSSSSIGNTIRVVDLQKLVENNINLINLYSKIEKDQKRYKDSFKQKEIELEKNFDRIEKLKVILDNSELEIEINKYNKSLNEFNIEIEKFNFFYDEQISKLKNKIVTNILKILKEYSINNKIDLILDSNSYILSNNSINITDIILDESNKFKLELNFEEYK